MARARNIKPSFFTNEELVDIEPLGRLLFIGLWTLADRKGRLGDRPKKIKMELLPCDDCNVDDLLQQLHESGLIIRYEVDSNRYIQIPNFLKHQKPHPREAESVIPAIPNDEKQHLKSEETNIKEQKTIPRYDLGMTKEEPSQEKVLVSPAESPFSESPISSIISTTTADACVNNTNYSDLSIVFEQYSNNIHPVSGQIEADKLHDMLDRFGRVWLIAAIDRAVMRNKRSLGYIEGILKGWDTNGFDDGEVKKRGTRGKERADNWAENGHQDRGAETKTAAGDQKQQPNWDKFYQQ